MAILNGARPMVDGYPKAVISMARQTVDTYDPEMVSGMDETEMAQAIGRLAATLGMLIATVEQPA